MRTDFASRRILSPGSALGGMALATLILSAAGAANAAGPNATNTGIAASCTRSAFPLECLEAGEAAVRLSRLVRRCVRGSDELRFSDNERGRYGWPTQAVIDEECSDVGAVCVATWKIYLDRRMRRLPDGHTRMSAEDMTERAQEECSLQAPVVYE